MGQYSDAKAFTKQAAGGDRTAVECLCPRRGLGAAAAFGLAESDGSYLFYFVGPDGHAHDFFCVGEQLRQQKAI